MLSADPWIHLYFTPGADPQRLNTFQASASASVSVPPFDVVPSDQNDCGQGLRLTWMHPEQKLLSKPQVRAV